jgi:hypothetical protein
MSLGICDPKIPFIKTVFNKTTINDIKKMISRLDIEKKCDILYQLIYTAIDKLEVDLLVNLISEYKKYSLKIRKPVLARLVAQFKETKPYSSVRKINKILTILLNNIGPLMTEDNPDRKILTKMIQHEIKISYIKLAVSKGFDIDWPDNFHTIQSPITSLLRGVLTKKVYDSSLSRDIFIPRLEQYQWEVLEFLIEAGADLGGENDYNYKTIKSLTNADWNNIYYKKLLRNNKYKKIFYIVAQNEYFSKLPKDIKKLIYDFFL